jgi:Cu(I)/Ag(I) efflux system membrane fusion protein
MVAAALIDLHWERHLMLRKTWWCLVTLGLVIGCTETDPDKINNSVPSSQDKGIAPPVGAPSQKGFTKDNVPAGYPMPKDMAPGGAATKGDESKGTEKAPDDKKNGEKAEEKTAGVKLSDDEIAEIKKLPAEDQPLALAQQTCLVGEEDGKPNHLGSMGMPVKKVVMGKTVFLCCPGCIKDLEKDPAKYLAKLKQ